MEQATQQQLPYQATKREVRRWYYKIPTRTVNQVIKASIVEVNRTSTIKTSLRTHALNRRHLKFIINELGRPDKIN